MDADDIRIFCALAFPRTNDDGRGERSPGQGAVARGLGMDEKTVRVRLRRLEGEGFIKYYQAAPALALLGMNTELTCRLEAMNVVTKLGALRRAQTLTGMVEARDFLGTTFVMTTTGGTAEEAASVPAELANEFELTRVEQGSRPLRPPDLRPSPLDWRIVERLRYDAHAPNREVAGSLGITARTVEYRTGKLLASGAIKIRPVIDARHQRGLVLFRLVITTESGSQGDVLDRLVRTFAGSIWAEQRSSAGPLLLDLFGFSLAEPEEFTVRALEVGGVRSCTAFTMKEVLEPSTPNWVDRHVAELASGRRAATGA